jgi:hypothetical protein
MYQPYQPAISRNVWVLSGFCLLGLAISLVALQWLDADAAESILNQLG